MRRASCDFVGCAAINGEYSIVGFNVPIDTLYAISETILRVIWKIDPTNSVIALKDNG